LPQTTINKAINNLHMNACVSVMVDIFSTLCELWSRA